MEESGRKWRWVGDACFWRRELLVEMWDGDIVLLLGRYNRHATKRLKKEKRRGWRKGGN